MELIMKGFDNAACSNSKMLMLRNTAKKTVSHTNIGQKDALRQPGNSTDPK